MVYTLFLGYNETYVLGRKDERMWRQQGKKKLRTTSFEKTRWNIYRFGVVHEIATELHKKGRETCHLSPPNRFFISSSPPTSSLLPSSGFVTDRKETHICPQCWSQRSLKCLLQLFRFVSCQHGHHTHDPINGAPGGVRHEHWRLRHPCRTT